MLSEVQGVALLRMSAADRYSVPSLGYSRSLIRYASIIPVFLLISTLAGAPFQARKANYLIGVFVCVLKLEGSR